MPDRSQPPVIEVEEVAEDEMEIFGEYDGIIIPTHSVEIHARVEGFLERMNFEDGSFVNKGDPLFYINNGVYKARVDRAKAQLKKDRALAEKAQRDVKRLEPLYKLNAASQLDLDNAQATLQVALANFEMSRAELEQAELELGYTVIRSPLSGYISLANTSQGSLVGNSGKTLLATVMRKDTVIVEFNMTPLDYLKALRRNVHFGVIDRSDDWQPVIAITLPDSTTYTERGIVDFASPQVNPETDMYTARAELPNPDQLLLPGQQTRVRLLLDVMENILAVPREAVIYDNRKAYVFVVDTNNRVERRLVEVETAHNDRIGITRGLKAGEKIITDASGTIVEGEKISSN